MLERQVESIVERIIEGLTALTRQVSRVAYALEANKNLSLAKCDTCRSSLVPYGAKKCPACGEFING